MIKVFFKGKLIQSCHDYWEAEAAARWDFFSTHQFAWADEGLPKNYFLVYSNS